MSRQFLILYPIIVVISACQVAPATPLERDQQLLKDQITSAQQRIRVLEQERNKLASQNKELKRLMEILSAEKESRADDSISLRLDIRKFAQAQIDRLKDFMVQSNLLGYIGEELVERTSADKGPVVFVDLENEIPRSGALVGVSGFFSSATEFTVTLLRPVEDRLIVVWQSHSLRVSDPGIQRLSFPLSVGVEKGDVVAYDFPISAGVKYDRGTGNSVLSRKGFILGGSVEPSSLKAQDEKRAYSIGVISMLE